MCTSLIKWENLPEGIPERYIEKSLFTNGKLAFVNNEDSTGFSILKCEGYSELNLYDEPIKWLCYSDNMYMQDYNTEDIEIIRNNKHEIATLFLIRHGLERICNLDRTIDKNLWYQRNLAIIKSTDETIMTNKNLMQQYDQNNFIAYGKKDLELKDNIDKLSFDIPFIADKLEDIKDRKWNELLNMLGINSANTSKKERLITDEANANNQLIELSADVLLAERQLAVERINKRWGLNIKVSLRNAKEPESNGGDDDGDIHN
jgi:hypothetical protein